MAEPTEQDRATATEVMSCWELSRGHAIYARKMLIDNIALALAAAREQGQQTFRVMDDGPCYYCGEQTNSWSGDPGLWPLRFCHSDDPGKSKWHHTACVTGRLAAAESARPTT